MKLYGKLFPLVALSAVVALLLFADSAWAPPVCGDGYQNIEAGEECEVGVPCVDPTETCDEINCLCESLPYCGDGVLNQPSEDCEVGVPCADTTWTCDEITCLCTPPDPVCGDGVINQDWEQCEVDVPCAEPGYTCDEPACLCTPPMGGEGCTPGYWKQNQHLDSWVATGYSPDQTVESAFGALDPSVDDLTLRQALRLRGGGLKALMRHAVAALLNSTHADVSYAMGRDAVIAMVQAAMETGDFETTKDALEYENEMGCPLN